MRTRRAADGYWPMREGELPRPSDVAREPRLAGLAENAIYRLALARVHKERSGDVGRYIFPVALAAIPLAGLRWGYDGLAAATALVVVLASLFLTVFALAASQAVVLVPDLYFASVALSPVTPREIAAAAWGIQLLPGRLRLRRILLALTLMAAWGGVFAHPADADARRIILPALFLAAAAASQMFYSPWMALSICSGGLHNQRQALELKANSPLKLVATALIESPLLIGFNLLPVAVAMALPALWLVFAQWIASEPQFGASSPAWMRLAADECATIGAALIASVEGIIFGALRGQRLRDNADALFEDMAENLGAIARLRLDKMMGEKSAKRAEAGKGAGASEAAKPIHA